MRRFAIPIILAASLSLGACSRGGPFEGVNVGPTAAGTGIGAATGGVIGSLTGNFGWGALAGAGAGALGGYLYDQNTTGS